MVRYESVTRFRLRYKASDLELPVGDFVIGRASGCHLALDDGLVSRQHATLHVGADEVTIEDLESRNGVQINDVRLAPRTPRRLDHLDRVKIGGQELLFLVLLAEESDAPTSCPSCGLAIERGDVRCRHCGRRLVASVRAAATLEMPSAALQELVEEATTGLDLITGLAEKTLSLGRAEEAERMVLHHLETVLRTARESGLPPDYELPTLLALRLAEQLHRTRWIDWVFDVHAATQRVLPPDAVDRLYELVRKVRYEDARPIRAYLEALRGRAAEFSASERFLVKRLEGLVRVVSA